MIRKIVMINKEKCNGCGACADACHEGAIAIVNGKAELIKDDYCDGFGDCLPECPMKAITIIEREAAAYDEEAVNKRKAEIKSAQHSRTLHMCPGTMARTLKISSDEKSENTRKENGLSRLMQWPVQIKLMPVKADYYDNADLLIAADCSAYTYAGFHEDFMKNHITLIGCPKLDNIDYSEKLGEILKSNNIKSVTIVRMEVPCCGGLEHAAVEALKNSSKTMNCNVVTITCDGKIKEEHKIC